MQINRANLKRLREFSGRSIRQLARESGVSSSHLAYVEKGQRNPKEAVIKKLADALGVPMEDIVDG